MIKITNKIILIFLTIIFCTIGVYSNANYTDLHLDRNGWCSDLEIQFKIYNITDFENKKEIENKLCKVEDKCYENKCELEKNWHKDICDPCNNCLYFHLVENAKVKIYDGPLTSRPILYETTSKKGDFIYTFNSPNQYLIEIETAEDKNGKKIQNYNNYKELIEVMKCAQSKPEIEKKKEYKNQNFNYLNSQVLVEIKNTTIQNNTEIIVRDDVIISNVLNNTIKTIGISSKNNEYDNINLKIKYPNNPNAQINLFKYDSDKNQWSEISNFKKENEYIVLENGELGIYSITQKEDEVILEETKTPIEEENDDEIIKETIPAKPIKEKNVPFQIGIILLGVLAVGFVLFKIFGNKNNSHYHDERNKDARKVLTTYEQTYQETSKYIEKYKDEYSKDQIFRALKGSGVPEDIINKVFNEKL